MGLCAGEGACLYKLSVSDEAEGCDFIELISPGTLSDISSYL